MKTVGIIVEYNPLHYGHVYHFEQAKSASGADAVIAVMSGHFLQRGEPALVNKWARAEMALRMGVDVVIELPAAFASQPAEWFAYGAASALDASGVTDSLCFGSESGEIGWLERLAEVMHREPEGFGELLRQELSRGAAYPAAYSSAVSTLTGQPAEGLAQPNNTLGLHYLIALKRLKSTIRPLTITRRKAGYHQQEVTDSRIASATAIRKLLFEEKDLRAAARLLPDYTYAILEREWAAGRAPMSWERFAGPLFHTLLSRTAADLASISEMTEGLEHRIKRVLPLLDYSRPDQVGQLLAALKTKRYTQTKLQRTLLRILLHHSKYDLNREALALGVPYLRILGFTTRGRELLKRMKRVARVPIISKVTEESADFLQQDIRATSVYSLGYPTRNARDLFRDYYEPPLRL
ncbi:nucleotidyltransferase [Paenibacillus sp. CC-CFT747]|nr:nucleotidyltransferase [Paenibacillus sp. CC-CFT747]